MVQGALTSFISISQAKSFSICSMCIVNLYRDNDRKLKLFDRDWSAAVEFNDTSCASYICCDLVAQGESQGNLSWSGKHYWRVS